MKLLGWETQCGIILLWRGEQERERKRAGEGVVGHVYRALGKFLPDHITLACGDIDLVESTRT